MRFMPPPHHGADFQQGRAIWPAFRLAVLVGLSLLVGQALGPDFVHGADSEPRTVEARRGMVVSVSRPASEIGRDMLRQGGNAVDAAVATGFALAVSYPPAGNIGGGGFMMIHPGPGEKPLCVDYREKSPAAAHRTMYRLGQSHLGARMVGVPGTVRGLALAHRRFGRLKWEAVVLPAARLADRGFELDAALAESLNEVLAESKAFPEFTRVYGKPPGKDPWKTGDVMRLPELAATLRAIAQRGPDEFYLGQTAQRIVAEMQRDDGYIGLQDLADYEAQVRMPIHGTYRGWDVYGPPPPSSGGICLVEMLNILERFDLKSQERFSPRTLHLMVEAMRRAYCDRARHLGDADFVTIPDHLTDKQYAARLAREIDPHQATSSKTLARDIPLVSESEQTTHFATCDATGMAVSNTYTLEQSYGSRVVVRGGGFLLNNEMGDFNWKPGHTDARGVIGTEPNTIESGKRMLSSMTPVIVAKDGRAKLLVGSPGGRTIINTVLCILINRLEYEMGLAQAVDAPRLHHSWFPDRVFFEQGGEAEYNELLDELEAMGHAVQRASRRQGDAHVIEIDHDRGLMLGVPDKRLDGHAAGY